MKDYIAHYSQLVMPNHINVVGTLFGGQMIAWIDLAAGKVAHRFLQGTGAEGAVTRVIKQVEFKKPVILGNWVNFVAKVIDAGKTSITIQVEAMAEDREANSSLACVATVIMVAVKKNNADHYEKFPHRKTCD